MKIFCRCSRIVLISIPLAMPVTITKFVSSLICCASLKLSRYGSYLESTVLPLVKTGILIPLFEMMISE